MMMRAVMSLCEEASAKIKVGSGYSDDFFRETWRTSEISVITVFICNCNWYGYGKSEKRSI